MSTFFPPSIPLALAMREQLKTLSAGQEEFELSGGAPRLGPLVKWFVRHQLEELRVQFESGNRYALMVAIRKCAFHQNELPDWAARAYVGAFDAVNNYLAKSWDDVFGPALPKGVHLRAQQARRLRVFKVGNAIRERLLRGGIESVMDKQPPPAFDVSRFNEEADRLKLNPAQRKHARAAFKRLARGEIRSRSIPIDDELFDAVASDLGLTTRQVKEAYGAYKHALGLPQRLRRRK
jgi:hypothetical protein